MSTLFTSEEQLKIQDIVKEYRAIYERTSYLSIEMQKMESEMQDLIKKLNLLSTEESTLYSMVADTKGISVDEVKTFAVELAINIQKKNQ
jgi:uncharacterized protein YfkK (UPF0435 family)